MRTKTLLLTAAALLAAGVVSTQAQPVYSQNIVGYTTEILPIGWACVNTPLDLSAGNTLTNIFPNPAPGGPGTGPLDFDLVYLWNGSGYTTYTLDSDFPSGVANASGQVGVPAPTVNPGALVYIHNTGGNVAVTTTNVLTGTVHYDTAPNFTTTFVGQTTNKLVFGYNFVASKLPIGGGFTSVLQLTNPVVGGNGGPNGGTGPLDFSLVYIPNIVNGNFLGYSTYTIDSDFPTGWANAAGQVGVPEPQLPVGAAAIIKYVDNNSQGPYYWIQSY
jgi:hypothetical protein